MKRMKQAVLLICIVFWAAQIAGCQNGQKEASEYHIYFVNKDKTKTVAMGFEPREQDTEGMIREFLDRLLSETTDPDYQRPVPENVLLDSWKVEEGQLYLYFNSAYLEMDNIEEVLCRAALVRTLIQPEGVECISFYVGDAPLLNDDGTPVGLMTADSFIENPGEQINTIQNASITLYFANMEGNALVQEVQEIHYNSNISLEKLVMEQLLKGPLGEGKRSALPDGTKLVGVSVLDGVCFVNLNENFLHQNYEITEPVVIYSIVNSLAELPNVNKVQISVNGDSNKKYREKMGLDVIYERNLDYIEGGVQPKEEPPEDAAEKAEELEETDD